MFSSFFHRQTLRFCFSQQDNGLQSNCVPSKQKEENIPIIYYCGILKNTTKEIHSAIPLSFWGAAVLTNALGHCVLSMKVK